MERNLNLDVANRQLQREHSAQAGEPVEVVSYVEQLGDSAHLALDGDRDQI